MPAIRTNPERERPDRCHKWVAYEQTTRHKRNSPAPQPEVCFRYDVLYERQRTKRGKDWEAPLETRTVETCPAAEQMR